MRKRPARGANSIFTGQLAAAIDRQWLTLVVFTPSPLTRPVEHIVSRKMNERYPVKSGPLRDDGWTLAIHA